MVLSPARLWHSPTFRMREPAVMIQVSIAIGFGVVEASACAGGYSSLHVPADRQHLRRGPQRPEDPPRPNRVPHRLRSRRTFAGMAIS